jgi:5-methylcytosine-specific restriction endonuclease McrA
MAGDWIKWVKGLSRRREVIVTARKLGLSRREVASACMEMWEWADDETVDGHVKGATREDIDSMLEIPGFSVALEASEVGWLRVNSQGVTFPRWERNNGDSAKRRAINSRTQQSKRAGLTGGVRRKCVPKAVKQAVLERDGGTCRYCGCEVTRPHSNSTEESTREVTRFHWDNVLPVTRGGDNSVENVVLCCTQCKERKGDKSLDECGLRLIPVSDNRHLNVTQLSLQTSDKKVTRGEESERRARGEKNIQSREDRSADRSAPPDSSATGPPPPVDRSDQSPRSPPPGRSRVNFLVREGEEPFDLSGVDWGEIISMAERAAKRVPPRTEDDRRAWLRYAVMADSMFNEAWLIGAAEIVEHAKETKLTRQAHFVAVLQSTAAELQDGVNPETFNAIARRVEIPLEVWRSDVLPVGPRHGNGKARY